MTPNLRPAAVAVLLLATLAACGEDEPRAADPTPSTPTADTPCLVTADQLKEITGTSQEIREVEVPGGGLGTQLFCETALDEREVAMTWSLQEPFIDPPPSHEEQRTFVEEDEMVVEEADLGEGQSGWVGAGRVFDHSEARVVTLLGDLMLHVEVNADDDGTVSSSQIKDEALALARAVVAARGK